MINITSELLNNATIQRFIQETPERFNDVIEKSVNRAAQKAAQLAKKLTPTEWGVKKEFVKDSKVTRADKRRGYLDARVSLGGLRTPLIRFEGVSPRTPMTGKTSGGVSVMLAGTQQRFKHAFIAQTKSGLGVFERLVDSSGKTKKTSSGKDKLRQLSTTTAAKMAKSDKTNISEKITPEVQGTFEKSFVSEAATWLNVLGAK